MMNQSSQPRSPVNELPTDILCQIFSNCVDQSSGRVLMQPNTKIAPMLLCQVCATWRAMALSLPLLWSHLRFELPLTWSSNDLDHPFTLDPEALLSHLEWLRWWRKNLASMAPYLQVELRKKVVPNHQQSHLPEPTSEFLLEFMSSAQFLCVGRLYQYLVQRHSEAGQINRVHSNAHTIVFPWETFDGPDTSNQYLTSILTQIRSTLRRLIIENTALEAQEFANPLNNWSTLTHLSISPIYMRLDAWFTFIRSLSALQSGSFHLSLLDNNIEDHAHPPLSDLPCLSVLHMNTHQSVGDTGKYPLKAVFDNLQLPTLHTLSLKSGGVPWYDAAAIDDVHAALSSAPAVTKLTLGSTFLGGQMFNISPAYLGFAAVRSDIEPLATYAPRLQHLSFAVTCPLREHGIFHFIDRIFASSHWLDLKEPTSTIQDITLVSSGKLQAGAVRAELVDRSKLISEVRRFVKDEVTVKFENEEPVEVRRAVWGW